MPDTQRNSLSMEIIFEEPDTLHIHGPVANIDDYNVIKERMDSLLDSDPVRFELVFHDAIQIPSVLIGYLIKIEKSIGIHLIIRPCHEQLYEQFTAMKLDTIFEVLFH